MSQLTSVEEFLINYGNPWTGHEERRWRTQKPVAETIHGNGYLEGIKSRVFLALTHFPMVRNYYSIMQVRKGTVRETRYSAGTKPATCIFTSQESLVKEHWILRSLLQLPRGRVPTPISPHASHNQDNTVTTLKQKRDSFQILKPRSLWRVWEGLRSSVSLNKPSQQELASIKTQRIISNPRNVLCSGNLAGDNCFHPSVVRIISL